MAKERLSIELKQEELRFKALGIDKFYTFKTYAKTAVSEKLRRDHISMAREGTLKE